MNVMMEIWSMVMAAQATVNQRRDMSAQTSQLQVVFVKKNVGMEEELLQFAQHQPQLVAYNVMTIIL
jgi:hypothetical protein